MLWDIKMWIIVAVGALLIIVGGLYLFQRTTVAKQKTTIETQKLDIANLQATQKALQGQVKAAEDNVKKVQQVQQAQQVIANNTAARYDQLKKMKTKCVLEAEDEKVINDIFNDFNTRGVLLVVPKANSGAASNTKSLH